MKFFLDSANLDEVREIHAWGVLAGVTTNPSLVAKQGGDFIANVHAICELVQGPVSAEVVAQDPDGMVEEGKALASVHEHVVVKVPLTPAGLEAVARLAAEGIKTNVTLCFQPAQALLAARAGASYISPFVGRLDDISEPGISLIENIAEVYSQAGDIETQLLSASIRHPMHVVESALAGADVATVPYAVFKKLLNHPLTVAGNERFAADWASVADGDILAAVQRFKNSQN
jgi:transaldolase